ncbi:MAG: hypothetical protein ACI8Q1_003226 [Parvicella sp.]|jgi:hypothetical protein
MKKILYLDDEKDDLTKPIVKKLELTKKLKVTLCKPDSYENEIVNLEKELNSYDGILLDLQLDGEQENGNRVRYQAPTLAQSIRTMATEGKIGDMPIILCSTESRIKETYDKDFTSHNLFDWTFLKAEIDNETIDKIICLCEGYNVVNNNKSDFNKILNRKSTEIDDRILSRFMSKKVIPPTHEIARVLFKDLVQPIGSLIDENILAARLGVEKDKSSDWGKLIDAFNEVKYLGVFSGCWQRWWSDLVLDKFEEMTGQSLSTLNALERVTALKTNLKIEGIIEATPDKLNSSSDFWTICQVTLSPLDPFEGYRINMREEPKPWQEYSYVSLIAIANRKAKKAGVEVHPSDESRLELDLEELEK